MRNFRRMEESKIDRFFLNLYRPLNKYLPGYYIFLSTLTLDKESFKFKILYNLGLKIPGSCYLKKKYKLSFTPCRMNPIFEYLLATKVWATGVKDAEFMLNWVSKIRNVEHDTHQ